MCLYPVLFSSRMLRHGSCALARLYAVFHEGLFSAKIFLTAALHDPIMQLLMEDECFLDIDPDKAVVRSVLNSFVTDLRVQYWSSVPKACFVSCIVKIPP